MFAPGFFAKTFFAGTYWTPNDGGGPIDSGSGSSVFRISFRVRRTR